LEILNFSCILTCVDDELIDDDQIMISGKRLARMWHCG
jgi:hypothetical protein